MDDPEAAAPALAPIGPDWPDGPAFDALLLGLCDAGEDGQTIADAAALAFDVGEERRPELGRARVLALLRGGAVVGWMPGEGGQRQAVATTWPGDAPPAGLRVVLASIGAPCLAEAEGQGGAGRDFTLADALRQLVAAPLAQALASAEAWEPPAHLVAARAAAQIGREDAAEAARWAGWGGRSSPWGSRQDARDAPGGAAYEARRHKAAMAAVVTALREERMRGPWRHVVQDFLGRLRRGQVVATALPADAFAERKVIPPERWQDVHGFTTAELRANAVQLGGERVEHLRFRLAAAEAAAPMGKRRGAAPGQHPANGAEARRPIIVEAMRLVEAGEVPSFRAAVLRLVPLPPGRGAEDVVAPYRRQVRGEFPAWWEQWGRIVGGRAERAAVQDRRKQRERDRAANG